MSLTAKQLEIRRSGVTATDVRVISGLDPYGRTPHDVWASKVLGVEDFKETEAIELGMALEPIVIPRLAKKVGRHALRLDPESLTIRHPDHPTHVATPDAFFAESAFHKPDAVGQIKVCGLHQSGAWGPAEAGADGIPDYVLAQVAWELHCALLPVSHVGALLGTEIRPYRIELTPDIAELIEALSDVADRFWTDHVVRKEPPPVDGSEGARRMLSALWPKNRGVLVRATAESETLAREYFEAKALRDAAEERQELAAQGLIACVGDGDGLVGEGWRLFHKERPETPVSYIRKAYRHFDMRAVQSKKGRAA